MRAAALPGRGCNRSQPGPREDQIGRCTSSFASAVVPVREPGPDIVLVWIGDTIGTDSE
jgi:hypothetical protein